MSKQLPAWTLPALTQLPAAEQGPAAPFRNQRKVHNANNASEERLQMRKGFPSHVNDQWLMIVHYGFIIETDCNHFEGSVSNLRIDGDDMIGTIPTVTLQVSSKSLCLGLILGSVAI